VPNAFNQNLNSKGISQPAVAPVSINQFKTGTAVSAELQTGNIIKPFQLAEPQESNEDILQTKKLSVSNLTGSSTVQRITKEQTAILEKFLKALEISAAAALQELAASKTMLDFREVVRNMKAEDVNKLMNSSIAVSGFGLKKDVQPYIQWLGEVRNERIASGAEGLEGKLNWVTSGVTGEDKSVVPKTTGKDGIGNVLNNNFTMWLRKKGPKPTDTSNMNCWEACLFAGFTAGAIPPWVLVNVYEIAKKDGQDKFDNNEMDGIVSAYSNAIAAVLGAGEEKWEEGDDPPPRGHLVFFNGPSHVAVSRGFIDLKDNSPAVMSLWNLPGPLPVMQATTIKALIRNKDYDVTFGPAPW
jgi:hypothetical protein